MSILAALLLAQATGRATMVKPVSCVPIEGARGQPPAEVARLIEEQASDQAQNGYTLVALLPGDVPIACFKSSAEPSKLPRGKR